MDPKLYVVLKWTPTLLRSTEVKSERRYFFDWVEFVRPEVKQRNLFNWFKLSREESEQQ